MSKDRKTKSRNSKKFLYEDGNKLTKIATYDRNQTRKKGKIVLDRAAREISDGVYDSYGMLEDYIIDDDDGCITDKLNNLDDDQNDLC